MKILFVEFYDPKDIQIELGKIDAYSLFVGAALYCLVSAIGNFIAYIGNGNDAQLGAAFTLPLFSAGIVFFCNHFRGIAFKDKFKSKGVVN